MAFPLIGATDALEVTVEARINSQQIINKFNYITADGLTEPGELSDIWLTDFIAGWRANMIPFAAPSYAVSRYWLRKVIGAREVPPAGSGKYEPIYSLNGLDYSDGTAADVGTRVVATDPLPTSIPLRVAKRPARYLVGYFKGGYNRFSMGQVEGDAFTTAEQWNTAFLTTAQTAMTNFRNDVMHGVVAPITAGWILSMFSPALYFKTLAPGSAARLAAVTIATFSVVKWVGTQATRRFTPTGLARGA